MPTRTPSVIGADLKGAARFQAVNREITLWLTLSRQAISGASSLFRGSRQMVGVRAMPKLFWRVADQVDYLVTLASLRIPRGQPSTRLDGQAPPEEGDSKTAAQRPNRRRREIPDRWVPSGRVVLEVFQDGSVHPKNRQ
jgi:hypothetical protein